MTKMVPPSLSLNATFTLAVTILSTPPRKNSNPRYKVSNQHIAIAIHYASLNLYSTALQKHSFFC
jgi:hypothetical protein